VEKAQGAKENAIDRAALALDPVRVSREMIACLVEDRIEEAGKRLRGSLLNDYLRPEKCHSINECACAKVQPV
jgi:hypothetical protein